MFEHLKDLQELPFQPGSIVKIHRGMNMIKVSVGGHQSEPSEVYIVTAEDGADLVTYVVFYMVEPRYRAIFTYDQNPFESDRRIAVETEASEFVEEMGAILEDIGWESMPAEDREEWLGQQFLFGDGGEEVVEVAEVAVDIDPEEELVEAEELEVIEDVDDLTVETETEPEEDGKPEGVAEPGQPEVEPDRTIEEAEKSGKSVVFAEEKFDEMLKQAFLSPSEEEAGEAGPEEAEGEKEGDEEETLDAEAVPEEEFDVEVTVEAEPASIEEKDGSEEQPAQDIEAGIPDAEDPAREMREKILRFFSKM